MENTNLFPSFADYVNNESSEYDSEIEDMVDEGAYSNPVVASALANDPKVIKTVATSFNKWAKETMKDWKNKDEKIKAEYKSADDYVQSAKSQLVAELVRELDGEADIINNKMSISFR